ncbi:MAG TPA: Gldg family protein [Steroidobacteraceae bacterium]|nr:Gldg family protein [Steroidobacteraceae bacterium]
MSKLFKKSSLGATGLAVVGVLFVAIMLLANLLLRGAKFDLTSDNLYTISDGTDHIVQNLGEPVNLYLFFSEKTATPIPQLRNHGVRVRELLEELVSRSNGKLTLKVVDPQPFSEEEDRATELGVQAVPISAAGDKLYLGLAATNSTDGKEAIAFLDPQSEEQLEYDVAKLIHKLSSAKKPVVGWLSSLPMQGDFDMQTGRPRPPWAVYGQVEQLYTVRNLEPSLTQIDSDIDVLVIVHPKALSPATLYAIDQFAMRGGHILAFVDPNAQADASGADPNNPMAAMMADKSSHLEPLLTAWGLEFKPDQVVADLERGLTVSMREGEPPSQHIAILGFDNSSMAKDVVTARLDTLNLATAGSLKPIAAKDGQSKLQLEPLIRTSAQAGLIPAQRFAMLEDPGSLRDGFQPSGELVIAARISGTGASAYPDGPPAGVVAATDALKSTTQPLNIIVIADSDLLSDFMWVQQRNFFGQTVAQPFANNGELVWNALDNLSGSADLISIRGRAPYSRPFERVEALRRTADARFRSTEQQLETQLQQTEEQLNKLQSAQPGGGEAILSPEAAAAIERFQEDKLRIRKELRKTKADLELEIKSLGTKMKLLNVLLMPLVVTLLALLMALWRKRRRHAIAMLRKGSAA